MTRNVIMITGTPCVGKTTIAKNLASKLRAEYLNLTELATNENLVKGRDAERDTIIIDETKMKRRIRQIVNEKVDRTVIIDGHYAPAVAPQKNTAYIFVLRRDPVELKRIMKSRDYPEKKLSENLQSEILDVCLVEALNDQPKAQVCEVNVTEKTIARVVKEILDVIQGSSICCVGIVDWLGKLQKQGLLDEYFKI